MLVISYTRRKCGNTFVCIWENVDLQQDWRQEEHVFIAHWKHAKYYQRIHAHTFIQFTLKSASFSTRYSPYLEMKGSQQSEQQWQWQQQHHHCSTNFNLYALNVESESWRVWKYTHKNTTKYELSIKFVLAHGNSNISSWINVWQCAATVKFANTVRRIWKRRRKVKKKIVRKRNGIFTNYLSKRREFLKRNFCISNRVYSEVWTETRTTSNSWIAWLT